MSFETSKTYNKYYEDTKKTRSKSITSANAQFNTTMSGAGATIGGLFGGVGSAVGGAIGLVGDLISWGVRSGQAKKDARDRLEESLKTYETSFNQSMQNRQDYINKSNLLVNMTKSNFDSTFGSGTYSMFGDLFSNVLGSGSLEDMISQLAANSGIENAGSMDMLLEYMSDDTKNKLLTSAISIDDVNSAYYDFLSEKFGMSDTQYGYQMRTLSNQEQYLNEQNRQQMEGIRDQYVAQLANAYNEQRGQNMQGAEALGSAESEAGSSGIRQTGGGNNRVLLQKYETMLAAAMYATSVNYALTQYENQLKTTQSGYLQQAYSLRNSINATKQQQVANFISQGNQQKSNQYDIYYKIRDAEEDAVAAWTEWKATKDAVDEWDHRNDGNGGDGIGGEGIEEAPSQTNPDESSSTEPSNKNTKNNPLGSDAARREMNHVHNPSGSTNDGDLSTNGMRQEQIAHSKAGGPLGDVEETNSDGSYTDKMNGVTVTATTGTAQRTTHNEEEETVLAAIAEASSIFPTPDAVKPTKKKTPATVVAVTN